MSHQQDPAAASAPRTFEVVASKFSFEPSRIEVSEGNGNHRLTAGDAVEVDIDDVVPFGVENGRPVRLVDVFHPAGNELTVAKGRSRVGVLGLEWNQEGTSGFSAPFAWSG